MKPANSILSGYGTTVFEVMSQLARAHDAVNLGQGFPDDGGPADVLQSAARAVVDGPNQYPPMMGIPELRQAVAAHDTHFYGLEVDWQREVMVTTGATEGLAACLFGLIEPGDEVVLFDPLYDSYLPIVRRAGGIPKLVTMTPPKWELPIDRLKAAFSDKTKLVLLNTPMNPAAKVFTREELTEIAALLEKHDAYAVCDEVYEHIVFDGRAHTSLITLPGMRERCLKLGSAGKTFSLTGWKVGYVTACPALLSPVMRADQFLVFTTAPNLQRAVADGLAKGADYFRGLADGMQAKRDRISAGLTKVGFDVLPCEGTYFVNADFRPLGFNGDDVEFCKHITAEARVAAIPVSALYAEGAVKNYARFCFAKKDAVIDEAIDRLSRHFGRG